VREAVAAGGVVVTGGNVCRWVFRGDLAFEMPAVLFFSRVWQGQKFMLLVYG
jgi:hypothetical protein